jgi:hypothetical protein
MTLSIKDTQHNNTGDAELINNNTQHNIIF